MGLKFSNDLENKVKVTPCITYSETNITFNHLYCEDLAVPLNTCSDKTAAVSNLLKQCNGLCQTDRLSGVIEN